MKGHVFLGAMTLLLAAAAPATAQIEQGRIIGTATDAQAAVLPGVTVTAKSPALIGTQLVVTEADGRYRFPALPSGTYALTYELPGFTTIVREGIVLSVGTTLTVDIQLQLATLQETVTVTGESPVIDMSTTKVGSDFSGEKLVGIPTATDIWSMLGQAPGVRMRGFDIGGSHKSQQSLIEALRTMFDAAKNEILIAGYADAIRPPNEEERELMRVLTTRFRDRLFSSDKENLKVFMNDWTPEDAAHHLMFDTTLNIDGMWGGYTGPGVATILPERAAVKIDSRLVPNQEIASQRTLLTAHLEKHGFGDIELRQLGGGDEWSQTSVREAVVQATLAMYKARGIEPMIWPRSPGSSPQWEYTRRLGLPAGGGGLGHGSRAHADDEYIVIDGNQNVAGIVEAEQSIVDLLYAYAAWPEPRA